MICCRELGASLDDIALQHLRDNFPLEQQQRLAAGFRTLADHWYGTQCQ